MREAGKALVIALDQKLARSHWILHKNKFERRVDKPTDNRDACGLNGHMPTNQLRTRANRFLHLAVQAHDQGRLADAHALTLKAAEYLEQAVSLEELRRAHRAPATRQARPHERR
jgi:hypothetical protein